MVKLWNLMTLPPSTEKRMPRQPGSDAPRVARTEGQIPRVLFSSPELRAIVVELEQGETLGDHRVRERTVVHVVSGRVSVASSTESVECDAGTLVTFDPGEDHCVRALVDAQLLLILAPWPAPEHYADMDVEAERAERLPPNASIEPTAISGRS